MLAYIRHPCWPSSTEHGNYCQLRFRKALLNQQKRVGHDNAISIRLCFGGQFGVIVNILPFGSSVIDKTVATDSSTLFPVNESLFL